MWPCGALPSSRSFETELRFPGVLQGAKGVSSELLWEASVGKCNLLVGWKAGWLISWIMLGIGGLNMIELSDMRGIIDIGTLARTK